MADSSERVKEFPDVSHKLAAPKKISAFEKERQAKEAKDKRAEAENAAILKEFEDSFAANEYSDGDRRSNRRSSPPHSGFRGGGYGGFSGRGGGYGGGGPPGMPRSGPGSLGPIPGPPPPMGMKRKRALDEMREMQDSRRGPDMSTYDNARRGSRGTPKALADEEDDNVTAPRPTIQLASLPPKTTHDDIGEILGGRLKLHSIDIAPARGVADNSMRSASAIVTLETDTPTAQIDAAVSALRDKYLGCGYYLSISRHLSSAAMHPSLSTTSTTHSALPFGAERPQDQHARFSMRRVPPPGDYRGFAPPASYQGPQHRANVPDATVSVRPPLTIEAIKAIHTVAERLLSEENALHALNIEAMLMAKPEVQIDERFAFLYDSRSPAGVYYRFLLWSSLDHDHESVRKYKRKSCEAERLFRDVAIDFLPPYEFLPFPDIKRLEDVVTDPDYNSSEQESDSENEDRKFTSIRGEPDSSGGGPTEANERRHLTPLKRARLVHLLARLPTSNTKLRKGDVARVTNFAIVHAGAGAEEIVDLLLLNVERPFVFGKAAKYDDPSATIVTENGQDIKQDDDSDDYEPDEELSALLVFSPAANTQNGSNRRPGATTTETEDPSTAKLIALYLISDILSASSTAGARNAWKYRSLFEAGLRHQQIFPRLGKLERELEWGRLKAEQWKRRVQALLGMWEGWSVFSQEVMEEFRKGFLEPWGDEEAKGKGVAEVQGGEKEEEKWRGKFKKVEMSGVSSLGEADAIVVKKPDDDAALNGTPMDDVDGAPMDEDDVDGKPMDDLDGQPMDDIDGTPMDNDDIDGAPMMGLDSAADEKAPAATKSEAEAGGKLGLSLSATAAANASIKTAGGNAAPRRRMRAEDMFADSDEE